MALSYKPSSGTVYNTDMISELETIIDFNDFVKVDLRVGTIIQANNLDWSPKLLELIVDFGPHGKRTILAGIAKWYQPTDLVGKQSIFVLNLEPRKMGEAVSEGMLVAADKPGDDKSQPAVILLQDLAPAGSRLH